MSITHERVLVNPTIASEMLATNLSNNRSLDRSRLLRYSADMASGRWHEDGAPIRFSTEGYLVDGQHRLNAVIRTNTSQWMLVVRGVSPESFMMMDTGKPRSLVDALRIRYGDITNLHDVSTLVNVAYRWSQGVRGQMTGKGVTGGAVAGNDQLVAFYDENREEITIAAMLAGKVYSRLKGPTRGQLGLCVMLFRQIDETDADWFVSRLMDGVELQAGDPILVLRNRILNDVSAPVTEKLPTWMWSALIIKAWNAYRQGVPMKQLMFRPGGAAPERFPEPR